ncbi:hypothetical protein ACFL0I_04730, partial [Gemmatimonadota bacterium]
HFTYDVNSQTLRELEEWEEPRSHPGWASVSPDSSKVVFSRECNLYQMGWDDYMEIVDARHEKTGDAADSAEAAVEVDENQMVSGGTATARPAGGRTTRRLRKSGESGREPASPGPTIPVGSL